MAMRSKKDVRTKKRTRGKDDKSEAEEPEETRSYTTTRSKERRAKSSDNDVSWYANNESLLRDAASMAFANPAGIPILKPSTSVFVNGDQPALQMPGVMAINILPTFGELGEDMPQSAISVAARNIYGHVRYVNSGRVNYDAPNLMLYLCAMDNLYSAYSFCARLYAVARTFNQRNRFMPRAYFEASGINYDNAIGKMAQFRYWLNMIAEKIGSLCVPATMPYFLRHMWLYQNIFTDGVTAKSQQYIYVPAGFWKYTSVGDHDTPALRFISYRDSTAVGHSKSLDDVMAMVEEMVGAVIMNEDLNIMSGDILKAFGDKNIWRLMPIHEDMIVTPVFNQEVLYQIHNLTSLEIDRSQSLKDFFLKNVELYEYIPSGAATADPDKDSWLALGTKLQADESNCIFSPQSVQAYNSSTSNTTAAKAVASAAFPKIIDFHHEDVTPADIMVASRLMCLADTIVAGSGKKFQLKSMGSEIVLSTAICAAANNSSGLQWFTTGIQASGWSELHFHLSTFAFHPTAYGFEVIGATNGEYHIVLLDGENVRFVTYEELRRLHETAVLSEFNVPLIAYTGHKVDLR